MCRMVRLCRINELRVIESGPQGSGLEAAFWVALFGVDEAAAVRESTLIRDVVADWDAQFLIDWRIGRGHPR